MLAAVAEGNSAWGGIAGYIGRKAADIAHPLNVLEDCGLIARRAAGKATRLLLADLDRRYAA